MVAKRAQLTAVALAISVVASLATPATAADARERGAKPLARDSEDVTTAPIVNRILDRWHPVATVLHQDVAVWRAQFGAVLARASIPTLQAIDAMDAKAGSVNRSLLQQYQQAYSMAVTDVGGQIAKQLQAAKGAKLGSPTTDLVFVGFTPCRIVDTRVSGQGISAQTQRNFYFYSDGSPASWGTAQGGDPGATEAACPNTTLTAAGGTLGSAPPAAAVATITAVNTTAAGNFVVWGGGGATIPNTSMLNWDTAGQIIANTTVIPWGGRTGGNQDFTVRYNGPTGFADVVVDVIGYFIENEATPLDCTSTSTSGPITVGMGVDTTISYPACAAGYTRTGGYCNGGASTGTSGVYLVESGEAACVFRNLGGGGGTATAISRCCRVPGR